VFVAITAFTAKAAFAFAGTCVLALFSESCKSSFYSFFMRLSMFYQQLRALEELIKACDCCFKAA
jgi:hypothetical protein